MTRTDDDWLLLNALADQELDAAKSLALERRMAGEPRLAADYELITALRQAVGRLDKPALSPGFLDRMAALASPTVVPLPDRRPVSSRRFGDDWRAVAASLVLAAVLASGSTYLLTAPGADLAIEEAVVSGHQRSLLASDTVDVASTDRHTVRPWFDAKLGIAPPTTDLSVEGFPLIGGRVDVVGGKAVPTLVYRRDRHLISVVAIPEPGGKGAERAATFGVDGGYNVARWSRGGFRYWAVSDLEAGELRVLVGDLVTK